MVGYQKKEVSAMCLTAFLIPAGLALLVLAAVLLVQGVRQNHRGKLFSSVGILAILVAGCAVMMEFITRPL